MSAHLLLVEDDETLRAGLVDYLVSEGYTVSAAADGHQAERLLQAEAFDLIVLDLMLPGPSGLDLLRQARAAGVDTPVLILTARGEESDKVLGLELGADDYVTKPFSLREVGARIRAHLRRRNQENSLVPRSFVLGELQVDLAGFELRRGAHCEALSPREVAMLEILYAARGDVVSRAQFLREIWGNEPSISDRTIDTHILNLRRKLEADPRKPVYLRTVHGAGYCLRPPS